MVQALASSWWRISRLVLFISLILLLNDTYSLLPFSLSARTKSLERISIISENRELEAAVSGVSGRKLLAWFSASSVNDSPAAAPSFPPEKNGACNGVWRHFGYRNSCSFVKATEGCSSDSLLDYLRFFFCTCSGFPTVGFIFLGIWLLALFFMLGNTAADFFCPSLEELSEILQLPPTVAGVTLLPLGNGAPDVFASIAAFIGAGQGQVGLNSVLGAGFFVSAVVAGVVSLLCAGTASHVKLHRASFVRDVLFYLCSVLAVLCITLVGRIYLAWAIAFLGIYLAYGVSVALSEMSWGQRLPPKSEWLLEPLQGNFSGGHHFQHEPSGGMLGGALLDPLLDADELADALGVPAAVANAALPQWMWTSNVAIYSRQLSAERGGTRDHPRAVEEVQDKPFRPLWGWSDEEAQSQPVQRLWYHPFRLGGLMLRIPLMLPRRLTIPQPQADPWSRPFGIASAALAPLLLMFVVSGETATWQPYMVALCTGAVLAVAAALTTTADAPRGARALPWLLGGFVMSVVWFYLIANELVSVLVALGAILNVDSALLGLTVLAWGNSIGDAVANVAIASNGRPEGVQIAWSGCYAGPMFNTLMGLGISLVLASWKTYPKAFHVPNDPTLPWTILFLVGGLLYSLVVLPASNMQLNRLLGIGLITLYICFMGLRLLLVLGIIPT